MEVGPPTGDRSWSDARARLQTTSATLSRMAALQLLDAYLRLRHGVRELAEDPRSTRRQFMDLVADPADQRRRRRDAEDRLRNQARRSLLERSLAAQRPAPARAPREMVELTDDDVVARQDLMRLLVAVGAGRVKRGDGDDRSMWASHELDGRNVRVPLRLLAGLGLVGMPMSSHPYLLPKADRLLDRSGHRSARNRNSTHGLLREAPTLGTFTEMATGF